MISVIMPVYRANKYIFQAVNSVLKQTYSNLELIIIDDYGLDGSVESVKNTFSDNRIKYYLNDRNMGIAYSRNLGLDVANGEYIAFMDDDDLAPLNRLKIEIEFLENNPEIDAVGGRYCVIDENDNIIRYSDDTLQNHNYLKACLMFYDPLGNGSMLFRKSIVKDNHIRFMNNCQGMEDYRFWVDFSQFGKISNLKEVMLYWRNIEGNETSRRINEKKSERQKKFAEIQKYAIASNGFDLSEEDLSFLTEMLPEGRFDKIVSLRDVKKLYEILLSICKQAKKKKMENEMEILIACRKQLSRRMEYSEAWDI